MPPSLPDQPARVRLTTPAEMAAAVPHLVGFHPEESLVVVALRGPRKRIRLTLRFDLPAVACEATFADEVARRLVAVGGEYALVVCCTRDRDDAEGLPCTSLVRVVDAVLAGEGIALVDALLVRDGRWWSYRCTNPACCPVEGTPLVEATDIAAAHALAGRTVLPDRRALAATVAPVGFLARRSMEVALDRVDVSMATRMLDGAGAALADETVALVATLAERYADPTQATVSDDEAARVILGLYDLSARDRVIAEGIGRDLDVMQSLFVDIARRAVPPDVAPSCTVLAWFAYANGNGGLTNVALDRACAADPAYSLAQLLTDALHQQVPPSVLRQSWLSAVVSSGPPSRQTRRRRAARKSG